MKTKMTPLFKKSMLAILVVAGSLSARAQVADFSTDEHLSPEVRTFLKGLNNGGPGLETMKPADARLVLVNAQAAAKVDYSGITESEKTIQADNFNIKLNIVRPAGVKGVLPVFIFIHGGGWVLGDYPTHKRMVRDLVVGSGAVGVFVNYTRTPDAQFPRAIDEIYAALNWVAKNGAEINVDGKRLAVVGNSVGGNMTAVMSLMSKERKGPEIKVAVMMWPIVDADFNTTSYQLYGADRFLTTPLMKWMYDMYIPDPEKRKNILASPLQATVEQLKGLPPTLIQVAENDVLRDEGEAYGRKLLEAGVKATTVRYNGVIHDFGLLNGLATIPQTQELFLQASAELKKYLAK
ncbi:acetyl esterase/lipase [Mucilaginibacter oryzae]|uniref:Acetyl esterase/lipase n=2 Tax=Mucilaginibacter oryzae TaxID=468058 RepID=A0A316H875_9SPHI|nr:acetyl esterase/lipase [Mucilaginibacter oryzae]